ncbi:MAG TPA: 16S rRNA (uracil(1498)-N(3))-methyltransferase, partial [Acinetobacter nosocomialis]|nr:16S rRNA (uracil(1498)-N(3))-methyltransferase [Acinetobacter nosocomialis]
MNIVLLEPEDIQSDTWVIHSKRQLQHLREHLDITVGQNLKVGIRNGVRYITEIVSMNEHEVRIRPIREEAVPAKLPAHLIVALPRPKVLRRLI